MRNLGSIIIMNYLSLFFVVTQILFACESKIEVRCEDFHNGTFQLNSNLNGDISIIDRNDAIQTEILLKDSSTLEASVKWISPCEYELKFVGQKIRGEDSIVPFLQTNVLHTRILETNKNYCIFEANMQNNSIVFKDTLFKLSD
jgi:hypothetical protein